MAQSHRGPPAARVAGGLRVAEPAAGPVPVDDRAFRAGTPRRDAQRHSGASGELPRTPAGGPAGAGSVSAHRCASSRLYPAVCRGRRGWRSPGLERRSLPYRAGRAALRARRVRAPAALDPRREAAGHELAARSRRPIPGGAQSDRQPGAGGGIGQRTVARHHLVRGRYAARGGGPVLARTSKLATAAAARRPAGGGTGGHPGPGGIVPWTHQHRQPRLRRHSPGSGGGLRAHPPAGAAEPPRAFPFRSPQGGGAERAVGGGHQRGCVLHAHALEPAGRGSARHPRGTRHAHRRRRHAPGVPRTRRSTPPRSTAGTGPAAGARRPAQGSAPLGVALRVGRHRRNGDPGAGGVPGARHTGGGLRRQGPRIPTGAGPRCPGGGGAGSGAAQRFAVDHRLRIGGGRRLEAARPHRRHPQAGHRPRRAGRTTRCRPQSGRIRPSSGPMPTAWPGCSSAGKPR